MQELFYRIQAVLRRTQASKQNHKMSFRDIALDLRSREAFGDAEEVGLTKLEFDLLYIFIERKNTILKQ